MNAIDSAISQPIAVEDESSYYRQATSWEHDRELGRERSERRAWWAASVAMVYATFVTIALVVLIPLKQTMPYVLSVEKATGNVEVLAVADARTVGYQELIDKHWAERYVVARESYLWRLLQHDYDTVLSMSADDVGRDYARLYDGPQARDKKFGPDTEMRIEIISVTLSPETTGRAVVRFRKTIRRQETENVEPPQSFVATMAYEYRPSMLGKVRQLTQNPMGYRVTAYRIDTELAGEKL